MMNYKLTLLLYSLLFCSTLVVGQGSWESYNHTYLNNKPITSYPYQDGLIVINSNTGELRQDIGVFDKTHYSHINFIDGDGNMRFIGDTAQFYGDPINDIKFRENTDSSLTILMGTLFDYDIDFPYHRFDIYPDTVISFFNYGMFNSELYSSQFPIGFLEGEGYVLATDENVFILDEEFLIIDTLDSQVIPHEICQVPEGGPLLYTPDAISIISGDSILTEVNQVSDLQDILYIEDNIFFVYSDRVIITDNQFLNDYTWDLPEGSQVLNITGSGREHYLTIRQIDPLNISLWKAVGGGPFGGEPLVEVAADLSEPGAIMGVNSDSTYAYTTTVEMSDHHQQTLINRTLKDGTFDSDYDYVDPVHIEASEVVLESIVFVWQFWNGMDTIKVFNHHYGGELTLTNTTQDTIHKANVFSEWLPLSLSPTYNEHFNYQLEEPLPPGQSHRWPIAINSTRQLPNEQVSFYCYGYNDRRLGPPIIISTPITATTSELVQVDFSIFPNPVKDHITISTDENSPLRQVNIYNNVGELVRQFDRHESRYDLSGLLDGIYHLTIATEEGGYGTRTLVKE